MNKSKLYLCQNTLGKNRLKPAPWSGSPLRLGKTSASPQNLIGSKVSQAPGSYKCKGFHRGLSPFVRLFRRGLSPFALFATAVTMQWTRDAEGGGAVAAFRP